METLRLYIYIHIIDTDTRVIKTIVLICFNEESGSHLLLEVV